MSHAPAHPAHGHHEEHGSLTTYLSVFVALLILTVLSFAVGNWQDLKVKAPGIVWAFMMAVSVSKALLVILFFMHLKWEANWKYVLTVPCCIMSVFLMLMLVPDVGRRTKHYTEERKGVATSRLPHYYNFAIEPHGEHSVRTTDAHIEKPGH
jgi:cytochrome c oxidase subunit IV